MNDLISALIRNSLITAPIILLFFLLSQLFLKRYESKWIYYSWLAVLLRLLMPEAIKIPVFRSIDQTEIISNLYLQQAVVNVKTGMDYVVEKPTVSLKMILSLIWIVGFIAFSCFYLFTYLYFMRRTRRWCETITDTKIVDIYQQEARKLKLSNPPKLEYCPIIGTPMLMGTVNTRIMLPKRDYDLEELRGMIRHELIHFKRKDVYYRYLLLVVSAIYWFDPLIYLVKKLIIRQCEKSCDEAVIRDMDMEQRRKYSVAILETAKYQTKQIISVAVNLFGGKYDAKERILFVLDMKKQKKSICMCIFALFCVMLTIIRFSEPEGKLWQTALVDDGYEKVEKESDAIEDLVRTRKESESHKESRNKLSVKEESASHVKKEVFYAYDIERYDKDGMMWGVYTDTEVNQILSKEVKLPEGIVLAKD